MKPSRRCYVRYLLFAGIALFAGGFLYGQVITSSIVGHVTDASGAAVPGAQVTVTNEGTSISVHATTQPAGNYTIPNLYAGVYTIQVRKEGFQAVQYTGIRVLAGESVRQDVVLKVGSLKQSVTVSGRAPLVHTDSMTISGGFTGHQLTNLPTALQSIDTFLTLVPGAQALVSKSNPEIGGSQYWGGTNYAVNGVSAIDVGSARGAVAYGVGMVALPPISSMQELKVNAANMNAEYRDQATIEMVTKQGSNKFHGELYEYNQNAKLAANSFTLNAAGKPRPPFNLNQFGGNVGGPIWRNKAFFFFNFSGFRQRQYSTVRLNFPSQAMRQGNFSALCTTFDSSGVCTNGTQLYNPYTGQPFANNMIPGSMITSQAKTLISYLPALTTPNSPGLPAEAPNYIGEISAPKDFDAYDLRLDWQISPKDSLTGFYTRNVASPWFQALGTPPNYGNGSNFGYKTYIYQLVETHIFSPSTINDFHLGWFNFPQVRVGQNLNFDPRSLFPQQPASAQRGLPKMDFTGVTTAGNQLSGPVSLYAGIGDYGNGLPSYQPNVEIKDNFTHVSGRHTFKAGVDISYYEDFSSGSFSSLPSFNFSGVWTGNKGNPGQPQSVGNAFADFLLGVANSSSTSLPGLDHKWYDQDEEFYVQDTWQATPRLTLNYGVRYMYQGAWTERNNLLTGYDFATNKLFLPQNSATPTLPPFGASATAFNAYLPYMTTTQALGFNLHNYFKPDNNNWGPRFGFAFRPFSNDRTVVRGGYGVFYNFWGICCGGGASYEANNPPWGGTGESFSSNLPGSPTSQFLPDITFSNPFPSSAASGTVVSPHPSIIGEDRNMVHAVSQQWNLTVEHEIGSSNMVRVSYVGSQTHHILWFYHDTNVPAVQQPNVPFQAQRPNQPWGSITTFNTGGKQNFNQLQVGFTRRFSNGLGAQVEYSWTSALTNVPWAVGGPQRIAYPNLDYTNNAVMARHNLVFDYIYALPVGHGKRWLGNAPGVVDGILGGWQASGITTYRTGFPFTVNFQVPASYVGWWGGYADRVSGVSLYNKQSGHDIINGVQWFNPAAFAPPQPWQWGNSQPYSTWGPGYWNWDISVQKYFEIPVARLERPRLQFRADFFDALNHFNLGGFAQNQVIADTRDGGPPNPAAGKIFSGGGSRTIQLGLRLDF